MIEGLLFVAGLLAGMGGGVFLGFRWGAKAQEGLGYVVKRVPIDGPSDNPGTGTTPDARLPTAPRMKTDWKPPTKGPEHPAGPPPPVPSDFVRPAPQDFTERLKTTPRQ